MLNNGDIITKIHKMLFDVSLFFFISIFIAASSNMILSVNSSDTNQTLNLNNTVTEFKPYDGTGAMHYIVTIVIVYGVGVMGVFVFSFFSRRKLANEEVDRQVKYFIKGLPTTRYSIEKEQRRKLISQRVPADLITKAMQGERRRMTDLGNGILSFIGIPLLMSEEKQNNKNDNISLVLTNGQNKNVMHDVRHHSPKGVYAAASGVGSTELENDNVEKLSGSGKIVTFYIGHDN